MQAFYRLLGIGKWMWTWGKKLVFPPDIVATILQPDMVLWSTTTELAYIVELTVPQDDGAEEAYERKKTKYSELAIEAAQNGWKTKIFPVEVGCIYDQSIEENGGDGSLPPTSNQVLVKCSRKKQ